MKIRASLYYVAKKSAPSVGVPVHLTRLTAGPFHDFESATDWIHARPKGFERFAVVASDPIEFSSLVE